jgi:large subunit ribosomal protein L22
MESSARQRNIMMSPRKVRRVINMIRDKNVPEAYAILRSTPFKASEVVLKKLLEAVANANQQYGVTPDGLVVSQVFADEGPVQKRFKPRAQGRIYQRLKKSTHLTITVKQVVS